MWYSELVATPLGGDHMPWNRTTRKDYNPVGPRRRTVTTALRQRGRAIPRRQSLPSVFNRARWALKGVAVCCPCATFDAGGSLTFVIDTGATLGPTYQQARSLPRPAGFQPQAHRQHQCLRWIVLTLVITPPSIAVAGPPILSVPAPTPQVSERLCSGHARCRVVRRWLPQVAITVLDQSYRSGHACRR